MSSSSETNLSADEEILEQKKSRKTGIASTPSAKLLKTYRTGSEGQEGKEAGTDNTDPPPPPPPVVHREQDS
eukprot:Awhi_evm1s3790